MGNTTPRRLASIPAKGMWLDSTRSTQPPSTYGLAFGVVDETHDESNFGIANEASNAIHTALPEGFQVRGLHHLPDRDQYVVMLYDEKRDFSEIGLIDIPHKSYTMRANDDTLKGKLCFSNTQWIRITSKPWNLCDDRIIYWTANTVYRYLNIDDPLILEKRIEDTEFFKCHCIPAIQARKQDTGGGDLPNGAYQYVAQLADSDGNTTNWFNVSDPVYLASKRAAPGEWSEQSVNIKIGFNNQFQFDRITLAVIQTIEGKTYDAKELITTSYTPGGFSYWHTTASQGTGRNIPLMDILGKRDYYMRGDNLTTWDDRLFLYELATLPNIYMQDLANQIDVSWALYKVPAELATDVKGLMGGEVIDIGIRPNYCDGTKGPVFHIPGRAPNAYDLEEVGPSEENNNCSECAQPRWKVEDTSWTESTYCNLGEYGKFSENQTYKGPGGSSAANNQGIIAMAVAPSDSGPVDVPAPSASSGATGAPPNVRGIKYVPNTAYMTVWEGPIARNCGTETPREWMANKMSMKVDNSTERLAEDTTSEPLPITLGGGMTFDLTGPVIDLIEGTVDLDITGGIGYPGDFGSVDPTDKKNCFDCDKDNPAISAKPVLPAGSTACIGANCPCTSPSFKQSTCKGCGSADIRWCRIEAAYGSGASCSGGSVLTRKGSCGAGGCSGGVCGGSGGGSGSGSCPGGNCGSPLIAAAVNPLFVDEVNTTPPDPSEFDGNTQRCVGINCPGLLENIDNPGGGNCSAAACGDCGGSTYKASEFDSVESVCGTALGYVSLVRDKLVVQGRRRAESLKDLCPPIPIYDEEGCYILGYDFPLVQEGRMGYWESENNTYPDTEDCVGRPLYRELSGEKVRRHKLPSRQFHPHVWSEQSGVVTNKNPGNLETNDTDLFFFGLILRNIKLPDNPPKPYCPDNPFTIMIRPRTDSDKSVIAKGLAPGTFAGEVYGDEFSIPKNGLNSLEYFDRHIRIQDDEGNRGGVNNDANGYMFLSPETMFDRPVLNLHRVHIELNFTGQGHRYGLYGKGRDPASSWGARINQRGYRAAINVNHPLPPYRANNGAGFGVPGDRQDFRCSTAATYVPGDSVVSKGDRFRKGILNLQREKSVYFELQNALEHLKLHGKYTIDGESTKDFDSAMGEQYNGKDAGSTAATGRYDHTSDGSLFTDTMFEEAPIYYAEAPYVSLLRHNPDQYGGVEAASYETLYEGKQSDLQNGEVKFLNGDTFIGRMTIRRLSYISENVGSDLSNGEYGDIGSFLGFAGDCGEVVIPGEEGAYDRRRYNGPRWNQRPWDGNSYEGFKNNKQGRGKFTPYFPGVQKTLLHFWVETGINLNHRQYGDEITAGEAVYEKLTEIKYDSDTPYDNALWEDKWMNRYYVEMPELTMLQKILRVVLAVLFLFLLGFSVLILALALVAEILLAMLKVFTTIGTALVNGIIWFINIFKSDNIEKIKPPLQEIKSGQILDLAWKMFEIFWNVEEKISFIDKILGIKQCLNDDDGGGNDRWVRQWEDNYYRYNFDYSIGNSIELSYGIPHNYYVCDCFPENACDTESEHPRGPWGPYNNKIAYSNKQVTKSPVDGWRNFKVNNYLDVPVAYGKLTNIPIINNRVFLHTTVGLINVLSQPGQLEVQGEVVYLGRGDLLNRPELLYGGVVEGVGGLDDSNAAIVTKYGYIFPDRESRQLFVFDGGAPSPVSDQGVRHYPFPVSDQGVRHYLQRNFPLRILQHFPDFRLVDQKSEYGAGYSICPDYALERLIITKRDWVPKAGVDLKLNPNRISFDAGGKTVFLGDRKYFDEVSFTLSYNPMKKEWKSFHWYLPLVYAWDRYHMYSFAKSAMWEHNIRGDFQNFYGDTYPMIVEINVQDQDTLDSFRYVSTNIDTEAEEYRDGVYIKGVKKTFDEVVVFSNWQSTGTMLMQDRSNEAPQERARQKPEILDTEFNFRRWNFSELYNRVIDDNEPLFLEPTEYGPPVVNSQNLNVNFTKNIFYDNYLTYRFTFRNFGRKIKLLLKAVITSVDYEPRND